MIAEESNFTRAQLAEKLRILLKGGFKESEADLIIDRALQGFPNFNVLKSKKDYLKFIEQDNRQIKQILLTAPEEKKNLITKILTSENARLYRRSSNRSVADINALHAGVWAEVKAVNTLDHIVEVGVIPIDWIGKSATPGTFEHFRQNLLSNAQPSSRDLLERRQKLV